MQPSPASGASVLEAFGVKSTKRSAQAAFGTAPPDGQSLPPNGPGLPPNGPSLPRNGPSLASNWRSVPSGADGAASGGKKHRVDATGATFLRTLDESATPSAKTAPLLARPANAAPLQDGTADGEVPMQRTAFSGSDGTAAFQPPAAERDGATLRIRNDPATPAPQSQTVANQTVDDPMPSVPSGQWRLAGEAEPAPERSAPNDSQPPLLRDRGITEGLPPVEPALHVARVATAADTAVGRKATEMTAPQAKTAPKFNEAALPTRPNAQEAPLRHREWPVDALSQTKFTVDFRDEMAMRKTYSSVPPPAQHPPSPRLRQGGLPAAPAENTDGASRPRQPNDDSDPGARFHPSRHPEGNAGALPRGQRFAATTTTAGWADASARPASREAPAPGVQPETTPVLSTDGTWRAPPPPHARPVLNVGHVRNVDHSSAAQIAAPLDRADAAAIHSAADDDNATATFTIPAAPIAESSDNTATALPTLHANATIHAKDPSPLPNRMALAKPPERPAPTALERHTTALNLVQTQATIALSAEAAERADPATADKPHADRAIQATSLAARPAIEAPIRAIRDPRQPASPAHPETRAAIGTSVQANNDPHTSDLPPHPAARAATGVPEQVNRDPRQPALPTPSMAPVAVAVSDNAIKNRLPPALPPYPEPPVAMDSPVQSNGNPRAPELPPHPAASPAPRPAEASQISLMPNATAPTPPPVNAPHAAGTVPQSPHARAAPEAAIQTPRGAGKFAPEARYEIRALQTAPRDGGAWTGTAATHWRSAMPMPVTTATGAALFLSSGATFAVGAGVLTEEAPGAAPIDPGLAPTSVPGAAATGAGGTASGPATAQATVTAQAIAAQLAAAASRVNGRETEVALSPEELGRVRLRLRPGDGTLHVSVLVERIETLDLMRRHLAELSQEFEREGYATVSFSFEQAGGENAGAATGDGRSGSAAATSTAPTAQPETDPDALKTRPTLHRTATGGLDLRL